MADLNLEDFEELLKVRIFPIILSRMRTSTRISVQMFQISAEDLAQEKILLPAQRQKEKAANIIEALTPKNEATEAAVLMRRKSSEDSTKIY